MNLYSFSVVVTFGEVVLAYRDGKLAEVLKPGRHPRNRRTVFVPVDVTEQLTMVALQEIPSADGVTVKVSGVVRWQVSDPVLFNERTRSPEGVIYLAAQLALRAVLTELPSQEMSLALRGDAALTAELLSRTQAGAAEVGVQVLQVQVRDVVLPAEIKAANLALAAAKARGQAQLEAARAETAALRSLANAAKVLDASPALTQLRLVQAAPPGAVVKLALDANRD